MTDQKIRVSIVGAGGWAKYGHIPVLQAMEDFEIVAISSRSRETAEAYQAEFNLLGLKGAKGDFLAKSYESFVSFSSFCCATGV